MEQLLLSEKQRLSVCDLYFTVTNNRMKRWLEYARRFQACAG
ncbi:MAG: hypothetical protein RR705_03275 [Lachnospiraceae bacterium]